VRLGWSSKSDKSSKEENVVLSYEQAWYNYYKMIPDEEVL